MFKIIFLVLGLVVVVVGGVLAYHGVFSSYAVEEKEAGPYTVVFKEHIGPYTKVSSTMDEVYQILLDEGLETKRGVGLYFDDPAQVPQDQLKSEVGSLIEVDQQQRVQEVKGKLEARGLQVREIEKKPSMVVKFPYRSLASYMIGPMKVYPLFHQHSQERGYSSEVEGAFGMEIYDVENKVIEYVIAIPE